MRPFEPLLTFRRRLGPRVWRLFVLTVTTGFFWFLTETFFVYVLQAFMVSLGLVEIDKTPLTPGSLLVRYALPALILFSVMRAAVSFSKTFFVMATQFRYVAEQRQKLFEIGLRDAHRISMKELTAAFGDTTANASSYVQYSALLLGSCFSALLFFAFGLYLAPVEMLAGLALLVAAFLPFRRLGRKIGEAGVATNKEWENISANLLSGLKNHFLLRVYRRLDFEITDGHRRLENFFGHIRTQSAAYSFSMVFPLMIGTLVIVTLTVLAQKVTHTPAMILVSFFYIFIRFSQAASEVGSQLSMIKYHAPSFEKLSSFSLTEKSDEHSARVVRALNEPLRSLRADGLRFAFDRKPLFESLNFSLGPGESLAVMGESGSGKSTLMSLLFGLLSPQSGNIFLNDRPLDEIGTGFYEQVGYIGPEPFLVEGTLRENLLFGHPHPAGVTDETCWKALETSALASETRRLENGLDHVMKDNSRFSTGQKQRLSIARAVLRRPRLFVFDEGTGHLDSATERRVLERIATEFPESLMIFVTHRPELAERADHLLTLGGPA